MEQVLLNTNCTLRSIICDRVVLGKERRFDAVIKGTSW